MPPRILIVGGGLAGLAAAWALRNTGANVVLWESRRKLGGRAASYFDKEAGAWIDHCRHVSMGCCTNLAGLMRDAGLAGHFRREPELTFVGPKGGAYRFRGTPFLPAPLHLAGSLLGLGYLTWRDRLSIARCLNRILSLPDDGPHRRQTMAELLSTEGQSPAAQELFWSVVLTSALSESLDRIAVPTALKVFRDGFVRHRRGYEVELPTVPLHELYDLGLGGKLTAAGVEIVPGKRTTRLERTADGFEATAADGSTATCERLIVAVPWYAAADLFAADLLAELPQVAAAATWPAASIGSVHLWYDRDWLRVPQAVLVGRIAQWIFKHPADAGATGRPEFHYEVVVSNARDGSVPEGERLVAAVLAELAELADLRPPTGTPAPLRTRCVTEKLAVFSPLPEVEAARPSQRTAVPGLYLAGDWTATGWPATMEGAVRSGFLAAEALGTDLGTPLTACYPDLPEAWLAKRLFPRRPGKP